MGTITPLHPVPAQDTPLPADSARWAATAYRQEGITPARLRAYAATSPLPRTLLAVAAAMDRP